MMIEHAPKDKNDEKTEVHPHGCKITTHDMAIHENEEGAHFELTEETTIMDNEKPEVHPDAWKKAAMDEDTTIIEKENPEIHPDAWKKPAAPIDISISNSVKIDYADDDDNKIGFAVVPEGDVPVLIKTKGTKAENRFAMAEDTTIIDKENPEIHPDAWKKAAAPTDISISNSVKIDFADDDDNKIGFAIVPEGDFALVPVEDDLVLIKTKGAKAENRFAMAEDTTIIDKENPEIHSDAWKKAAAPIDISISNSIKIDFADDDDNKIGFAIVPEGDFALVPEGDVLVLIKTKVAKAEFRFAMAEDTTIIDKENPEIHSDAWKKAAAPIDISNSNSVKIDFADDDDLKIGFALVPVEDDLVLIKTKGAKAEFRFALAKDTTIIDKENPEIHPDAWKKPAAPIDISISNSVKIDFADDDDNKIGFVVVPEIDDLVLIKTKGAKAEFRFAMAKDPTIMDKENPEIHPDAWKKAAAPIDISISNSVKIDFAGDDDNKIGFAVVPEGDFSLVPEGDVLVLIKTKGAYAEDRFAMAEDTTIIDKEYPEIHPDAWKKAAAPIDISISNSVKIDFADDDDNKIGFAVVPEGDDLVLIKTKGAKAVDRFAMAKDPSIMHKENPEIHPDAWKEAAASFVETSSSVKVECSNKEDKKIRILMRASSINTETLPCRRESLMMLLSSSQMKVLMRL